MRLVLIACLVLAVTGCVDFTQQSLQSLARERQVQENAAAVSRWDLFLNSRIDDLYARISILEMAPVRPACRGR